MNLPQFSAIETDSIVDDISKAIAHCKKVVEEVVSQPDVTYQNLVAPLEEADDELGKLWSPVSHMNSVVSSDALRQAHDACLPLLSEYGTWMGQHEGLYKAYRTLRDSDAFSQLDAAQQKLIDNAIRDFTLSGVALPSDKKQRFADIQAKLSELASKFSNNVMDATMGWVMLRQAHDACLPLLSEYGTWMGQHEGLYKAYRTLRDSDAFSQLDAAQQKLIDNAIRDFTLSGVALPSDKKQRFADIQAKLSELASKFSNNVMDATMGWVKQVEDEAELEGIPDSAKAAAKQTAQRKEMEGWVFTLDIPSYLPVMLHAKNRALREEMYRAYATRASDQGSNAELDNSSLINNILSLRQEAAHLLGFKHYAERSLATKMATNTDQVLGFLQDLAQKSKPQANRELDEVKAFAAENAHNEALQAWDIPFYSERLKEQKFSITDEELKPYFPEDTVLKGLFEVVSRLYGLTVEEQTGVDVYHDDVRFFTISDASGAPRGSFYLDLYARENKRGGAWMDECRVRRTLPDGRLQLPVAYLTCNFSSPIGDKPALFTHDEVVTLFHEFGHGIHHMLTKMTVAGVSGINGVPWDAVELPSQFLENWCWQEESLAFISGHYETGEPLPKAMLDKMLAARDFQSAMQMVRQLEFSLFEYKKY